MDTPITLEVSEQTVPDILRKISSDYGVKITFSSSFLERSGKRTIAVNQQRLGDVLNDLLKQTGLSFKVSKGRILLFRLEPSIYTISGYIEEHGSGERLIAATVYSPNLGKGTVTNEYGFFSLSLPQGQYQINVSYLGYEVEEWSLSLVKDISKNVQLKSSNYLTEVIVTPDSIENPYFVSQNDRYFELSPKLIHLTPSLGGANDPIKSTQLLPGVQSGSDGLGGIQVRGSNNGHNQMLLDGVPVYIPYHLLGVFSVYNPSTVQSAKLLNGKFSARYGGSLSSVFDVRIREGNRYKWHVEGGFNLTNAQLLVEGPLKKEKSSVLLAIRTNHSSNLFESMLNRTVFLNSDNDLFSNYLDINGKVNYQLSNKDRIYLSYYKGGDLMTADNFEEADDQLSEQTDLALIWGNTITSLRWNHLFNDKLFANVSFNYSLHEFQYSFLNEIFLDEENFVDELFFYNVYSRNRDKGIRLDFDYLPSPKHSFRFGAGFLDRTFSPEVTFFDEDAEFIFENNIDEFDNISDFAPFIEIEEKNAKETYAYFEDRIVLNDQWQFELGLRASSFIRPEEGYFNVEPRLNLSYQFSPKFEWNLSNSRMVQYLHLISSSSLTLPTDLWLPASERLQPQTAWLTEMDFKFKLSKQTNLTLSAYYKTLQQLYILPDFVSTIELNSEDLDDLLIQGNGKSKGLELLLDYHQEKNGLIASYVLSKSDRNFPTETQEQPYPFEYDSRHQFKIFFYQQLSKRLYLSFNWQYNSPSPRRYLEPSELGNTLVTVDLNELGRKNELRSSAYHRLDFDLNYQITGRKLEHQFKFGAYNLYNRKNAAFYEIVQVNHDDFGKAVSSLPFLPSFSYKIKF